MCLLIFMLTMIHFCYVLYFYLIMFYESRFLNIILYDVVSCYFPPNSTAQ